MWTYEKFCGFRMPSCRCAIGLFSWWCLAWIDASIRYNKRDLSSQLVCVMDIDTAVLMSSILAMAVYRGAA